MMTGMLTVVLVAIDVCTARQVGPKGGQTGHRTGQQVELTPHQGLCWSGDDALARTTVDVDCPRQALSKWSTDGHVCRHGKAALTPSALTSTTQHFTTQLPGRSAVHGSGVQDGRCIAVNQSGTWVYTSLRGWKKLPVRENSTGEGTYVHSYYLW